MISSSIKIRLLAAGSLAVILALLVSGWGIEKLFERHVERRAVEQLRTDLHVLLSRFNVDSDGHLTLGRLPTNPRYEQPFNGLYWQIEQSGQIIRKSRSLWDESLSLPAGATPTAGYQKFSLDGPNRQRLVGVNRIIAVKRASKTYTFSTVVALNQAELSDAVQRFRVDLAISLVVLGLALVLALWVALSIGLAPLDRLRSALRHLRAGKVNRLTGTYPSEVRSLVEDLNKLLGQQEAMIERAKARTGNLAHGIKTPLTAISMMADDLVNSEPRQSAKELAAHVAAIERHLERELALARSVNARATARPVLLKDIVGKVVQTMQRLPRGADLNWSVEIAGDVSVKIDEVTLGEIVGNLLDNARKWAREQVLVYADSIDDRVTIEVSDDGPGIPEGDRKRVVQPGQRLDRKAPGSGLGLSIVADITEQLGGELQLEQSASGGLRVRVRLPAG